ncbi:unnamed protein product [Echinostoma caproni]|uniref:Ig-like domain-containing protein n=1 Tax=Echinostoma caproni TaxID=27848 RepID=A0A183ALN7_9TREM|nr:unnamed protein product [Echinostoma caproni]
MDPMGSVAESVSKVFTCQLNDSGSNPPSELTWTQLDSAGALLPLGDEVHVQPTEQLVGDFGALIARSVLTVVARRAINGRRFECTAVYRNKKTMLRAEEILEVKFAPNNVGLTALPMDGVRESQRLDLTCATSSCHPPAVIRWFEVPNHGLLEDEEGSWTIGADPSKPNELSDLAQMDTSGIGGIPLISVNLWSRGALMSTAALYRPRYTIISNPTMVQLISHPTEPLVGQTVLLSCQTSGGNPQTGFTYSWFAADRFQLAGVLSVADTNRTEDGSQANSAMNPIDQSGSGDKHLTKQKNGAPSLKSMLRLTSHQEPHLNLTNVKLTQRGWYACQVASAGGASHSTGNVRVYLNVYAGPEVIIRENSNDSHDKIPLPGVDQPRIDRRTRSRVQAHTGESVAFRLFIDANPPWADAIWFQLNNDEQSIHPSPPTSLSDSHGTDTFFMGYHPYLGYDEFYDYDMGRKRRRRMTNSLSGKTRVQVGGGKSDRLNIVAQKGTGEQGNLTFILNFLEVKPEDFGEYICQLRHKLGVQEFPFQLVRKSESDGILPSSVAVVQRGPITVVRFRPPGNPRFTRLVLRVCRRGAYPAPTERGEKQTIGRAMSSSISSSYRLYDLRRHKRSNGEEIDVPENETNSDVNSPHSTQVSDSPIKTGDNSVTGGTKDCEDYLVAKPHSGETEVHLSDAVQLYNFRLILYQGTRVVQETPPVVWQPGKRRTTCHFIGVDNPRFFGKDYSIDVIE